MSADQIADGEAGSSVRNKLNKTPKFRTDINALIGGLSTTLDSIATVDLDPSTGICLILAVSIGPTIPHQFWVLQAGTEVEDPANGIVRPDDYAAGTNEKVWKALSAL